MRGNPFHHEKGELLRKLHSKKNWYGIMCVCAVLVIAVVVFTLRYTGEAMEKKYQMLHCTVDIHQHTDSCYRNTEDGNRELICGYADCIAHVHNDDCYDEDGTLVCTLEEIEPHVHSENCYDRLHNLVCGKDCLHKHDDSCYIQNEDGENVFYCTYPQLLEHIHGKGCFVDRRTMEFFMDDQTGTEEADESGNLNEEESFAESGENDPLLETNAEEKQSQTSETSENETGGTAEQEDTKNAENKTDQIITSDSTLETDDLLMETEETGETEETTDSKDTKPKKDKASEADFASGYSLDRLLLQMSEGMYGNYSFSYNNEKNAFLTEPYRIYRRENGALGQFASSFHIVAFDTATLNSHTNGNILAKNAIANGDFGTRNYENELSYIQNYIKPMQSSGSSESHRLVIGSENEMSLWDSNTAIGINQVKISKPYSIMMDRDTEAAPFIDLNDVKQEILDISGYLSSQSNVNIQDIRVYRQNENDSGQFSYIRILNPDAAGYLNTSAYEVNEWAQRKLHLTGFETTDRSDDLSKARQGSLIINVDCKGCNDVYVPTESLVYFNAEFDANGNLISEGKRADTCEVTEFSGGKVIWNFINTTEQTKIYVTEITGIVIAPNASVYVNKMNGNIIANNVVINGESHRTDFTGTTIPFEAKLRATKLVNGQTVPDNLDGAFTFLLEEYLVGYDGWHFREIQRVTNQGSQVFFPSISYGKPEDLGLHWYKISEIPGDENQYQFDQRAYIIKVNVYLDGSGNYQATYDRFVANENGDITIDWNSNISTSTEPVSEDGVVFDNKTLDQKTKLHVDKKFIVEKHTGNDQYEDCLVVPSKGQVEVKLKVKPNDGTQPFYYEGELVVGNQKVKATKDTTFTITSEGGWSIDFCELPLMGRNQNNQLVTYEYLVEEVENSCKIYDDEYHNFTFEYMEQNGNTVTLCNRAHPIRLQVNKKWFKYDGEIDNIQNGGNPNVCITFLLEQLDEKGTQIRKSKFVMYANELKKIEGSLGSERTRIPGVMWSFRFENLQNSYLREDGTLGRYTYRITEIPDEQGFTYGKYVQVGEVEYDIDACGVVQATMKNRTTESYVLPETGGKGTIAFRIKRWFQQFFNKQTVSK